jgi:hypothetical protein
MRRIISRSLWRKLLATVIAMTTFVLLYEVTTFDSRDAVRADSLDPTAPDGWCPSDVQRHRLLQRQDDRRLARPSERESPPPTPPSFRSGAS